MIPETSPDQGTIRVAGPLRGGVRRVAPLHGPWSEGVERDRSPTDE